MDFSARQQAIKRLIGKLPNSRRYPRRRYRSPDGYPDHLFVHRLKEITKHYADSSSPNEIYDLYGAVHAEMQGLTIEPFYLTSELLEYFINTDLPSTSSRYQESCPILEVVIPHNLIQDEDGDSVVVLIVVDYALLGKMTDVRYGSKPDIPMPLYSIIALTEHGSLLHAPIFKDGDLNPCADGEGVMFGGQVSDVLQQLKSIGLNLLLFLESYPDYVCKSIASGAALLGASNSPSTKKRSIHAPRIIGLDFLERSENVSSARIFYSNRVGKKKAPHLRRGHWRRVRIGSGGRLHRWSWIQPRLINHD